MNTLSLMWRVLAVFIFHNNGLSDVAPVAMLGLMVWSVLACAYVVLLEPEPYPKFFGVPARRAAWTVRPFPWKWIGLMAPVILFWMLFGNLQ